MKLLTSFLILTVASSFINGCHVCRYKRSSALVRKACKATSARPQSNAEGETVWSQTAVSNELDDYLIPDKLKKCAVTRLEKPTNFMKKRSLAQAVRGPFATIRPIGPQVPIEPIGPIEPIEPIEPIGPVRPIEPIDRILPEEILPLSVVLEQINVQCVGMSVLCGILRDCALDLYKDNSLISLTELQLAPPGQQ